METRATFSCSRQGRATVWELLARAANKKLQVAWLLLLPSVLFLLAEPEGPRRQKEMWFAESQVLYHKDKSQPKGQPDLDSSFVSKTFWGGGSSIFRGPLTPLTPSHKHDFFFFLLLKILFSKIKVVDLILESFLFICTSENSYL